MHEGQEGKLSAHIIYTAVCHANTSGVRRVGSSLKHYGDLEKNPVQHLRPLLDSAAFLKSCLAVEKPIRRRGDRGSPAPFDEREREMGRNSDYCSNVFGSRELNRLSFSVYKERRKHQKSFA